VSVTQEQNLLIHDTEELAIRKQIVGHNDEVTDIKYVGKEQTSIAVATNSEQIRLFDVETMSSSFFIGHKGK
jgi:U3 small nucleolar RNA-associated protein 13